MDPQSPVQTERSISRGRALESSGRGGAGNIGRLQSPDLRPTDGPDDFSVTRGREPIPANATGRAFSSGRGGSGNIRPVSRTRGDAVPGQEYEGSRVREISESKDTGVRGVGRGGTGNIIRPDERSQSRSRSRGPAVHSIGRGGAGNLKTGEPTEVTIHEVEDQERYASHHHNESGLHSTGRGGFANIKHDSNAPPEHEAEVGHPQEEHSHEFQSTGRGGAGNIRNRSSSREPAQLGRVAAFFHRLGGKDGERPAEDTK